ncbi:MAG: glycosyltransferase [Candidatus Adiutrix sp.]|nr:glycosyltransferase [Candidatus Adiutrix sp.]
MAEKHLTRADLLAEELTRKNLAALIAGGQAPARSWLENAPAAGPVSLTEAGPGPAVVVAGGRSQASRRDPVAEAGAWLAQVRLNQPGLNQTPAGLVLFGFGHPWAARLILAEGHSLAVFEPDPLVVLAVFSGHDFSAALADPAAGLTLLTPRRLADGPPDQPAALLIHPPAQRRAPAQLANLTRWLARPANRLRRPVGPDFRLLVVPPLSGGPEPVAEALARAAQKLNLQVRYLDWGPELKARERAVQGAATAENNRALTCLLEETGRRAAQAAAALKPDLVVALAQAPLTVPALNRLRDLAPEAVLAFWLVEDFRLFSYALATAPAYDAIFHIQAGLIEPALREAGLSRAHYLPPAADPQIFRPLPAATIPAAYRADLSFMGAGYPNRVRLLGRLAADYWPRADRPPESFKIFGSGWPTTWAGRGHLFEDGRRMSSEECALIYAGGRVNLNLHSSLRSEADFDETGFFVNPRTFEIAAAGGLQITDPRPLLPPLFTAGRELAVAESPADLPGLIDHYLNHPEEAAALGRAARDRVLAEHTYRHRLETMLTRLGFQAGA